MGRNTGTDNANSVPISRGYTAKIDSGGKFASSPDFPTDRVEKSVHGPSRNAFLKAGMGGRGMGRRGRR